MHGAGCYVKLVGCEWDAGVLCYFFFFDTKLCIGIMEDPRFTLAVWSSQVVIKNVYVSYIFIQGP